MPLGAASAERVAEVEPPAGLGGFTAYHILMNSECRYLTPGVRAWVLRSKTERETTQTNG